MDTEFLTVPEAAAVLKVQPSTLSEWVREGRIGHIRYHNRRIRITPEHIEQYKRDHEVPPAENLGRSRPKRRRAA